MAIILASVTVPVAGAVLALAGPNPPISSKVDPELVNELSGGRVGKFMVILKDPDWDTLHYLSEKGGREAVVTYLKRYAGATQRSVEAIIRYTGGRVLRRFWLMNAILVEGTLATANAVAQSPLVKKVVPNFELHVIEPVQKVELRPGQTVESWGIQKIRAPEAWALGYTGEGIRIAVIDTGVDITHPALQGKMLTIDPSDPNYPGGWIEFDENGNPVCSQPHDTDGHGTHTSGTALGGDTSDILIGVAPDATLMHALVLPGGSGTFAQVLAGMEWAVDPYTCDGTPTNLPAHVMSMSLGASNYYGNDLLPAVKAALEANIIVVAAIGNDGPDTSSNPGNIWGVFGVGATDENDNVAYFSSGEVVNWPDPPSDWPFYDTYPSTYIKPDVSAPGVGITSSVPGGGYEAWDGTSMATPHVAGTVALILQAAGWTDFSHPDTPEAVYEILNSTAVDLGDPGQDTRYGYGRIDAYEAVSLAMQYAKKTGVEGHVYDSFDNSPIPWATVTVLETNDTVEVNDEGYFRIPLDPGNYTLLIEAWGYESQTISVEVVSGNGTIAGVVKDYVTGDPIANAVINVSNGTAYWLTYTNSTGGYSIEVPAGTYNVSASAPGYINQTREVNVGEEEVVIVNFALVKTSDLATIYGWVTDADTGDPVSGATVELVEAGLSEVTNASGYYEFTGVLPGNYTLRVNATGYDLYTDTVELLPGAVLEYNVSLTPAAAPGAAVAIVGNVHYYTEPHLDDIVQEVLGITPVMYDNVTMILQDMRAGATFSLIIVDHFVRSYSLDNATEILEFLNRTRDAGIPVIFLGTSYSSYGGVQALYVNDSYYESYGFPAPDEREYHYPSPEYVRVYVPQNMTSAAIFAGISWDGTDGNFSWFYLADLADSYYADYEAYNFTDDIGVIPMAVINDSYNNVIGVGVAVWSPAPGIYWYYLASWGESYWMQYYEPGSDGVYSNNTLTLLKNAISLAYNKVSPFSVRSKAEERTPMIKPSKYTYVDVYLDREPWGTLEGYVYDQDGNPLAGAKIVVEGAPFVLTTDSEGHFSHWLPAGTYDITVTKDGYTTYEGTVTITEGETTQVSVTLSKLTWIAVMFDYQGSLKDLIESRVSGVYVKDFSDWQQLHDEVLAGGYDVVIFAGYYYAPEPDDPAQFLDILSYMNETGKGIIFLDSWGSYAYGIRLLNEYLGDPQVRDDDYGNGYVYYIIQKAHPIFSGFEVGEKVYIIAKDNADYAWFLNFSGTELATIGADNAGVVGDGVAVKEFPSGSKWALLATLTPTSWNSMDYWTEDAKKIFINTIYWMLTQRLEVSLEPSVARVGDTVNVTVSGGEAGLDVAIYFNGEYLGNVTLNADGVGSTSFTVPTLPSGTYLVEAIGGPGGMYYGSAPLKIVESLEVSPSTVAQAAQFTARLTGAAPKTKYYLFIDGNILSFFVTDENGTAEVVINVPYFIGSGTHYVRVVEESGDVVAEEKIIVVRGELYSYLSNRFNRLEDLLNEIASNITEVRNLLTQINATVATGREEILNAISSSEARITALITTKTGEVLVAINNGTNTVLTTLSNLEAVVGTNNALLENVRDMLASMNTSLSNKLDGLEDTLTQAMNGYVGYLAGIINDSRLGIIAAIKASEATIIANLTGQVKGLAGIVETKTGDIVALIETKYGIIAANLTDLKELTGSKFSDISNKIEELESTLSNNAELLNEIKNMINNLNTNINNKLDGLEDTLTQAMNGYVGYLAGIINDSRLGIIAAIKASEATIIANLTGQVKGLAGIVETKTGDIVALIETKYGIIAANLTDLKELTGSKFSDISNKIEELRNSTEDLITTKTGEVYQAVQTQSGRIIAKVDALTSELRQGTEEIKSVADSSNRNAMISAVLAGGTLIAVLAALVARRHF